MHNFKIGDKVFIPKQKTAGDSYSYFQSSINNSWRYLVVNSTSFNTIGVEGPNREHITSNCFNPEDLEPYTELEFQVGDQVKVIKDRVSGYPVGQVLFIKKIDLYDFDRAENCKIWGIPKNTMGAFLNTENTSDFGAWCPLQDLKLIKKANMETFKKGDIIELIEDTYGILSKGDRCTVTYQGSEFVEYILPNGESGSALTSRFKLVEERKIIGYKAPYDLFNGKATKGSLFTLISGVGSVKENSWYAHGDAAKTTSYSLHLPKEIVETWKPVYEELKPTEILVILAHNNTKVSVSKGKIIAEGIIFTEKDYIKLSNLFSQFNGTVGKPEKACYAETVKVGCTEIMRVEFLQIEKAWKQLN